MAEAAAVLRPTRAHAVALFVLVGLGYAAGYQLASNWFSAEDQGASFFPAAGITLATLVLVSRRLWPVVLAAAATTELALDLSNGTDVVASLGYALANTAEPLVGALLLTTLVPMVDLRRTRHLAAFIGAAVVAGPIVGATIAATTWVAVGGGSGWARFAFEWWCGDGLGVLVVAGALLSLRSRQHLSAQRLVETAVVGAVAVAATATVFETGWFEFVYLPAALLVVLAFRAGTTAVAVTSALVAFVAAGLTAESKDFWSSLDVSPANRILYMQLALGVLISAVLALAAEISERERMAVALARTESEREAALERARLFDSERAARKRAELLERHAAALAAAADMSDVAAVTISHSAELADVGTASVQLLDKQTVRPLTGTRAGSSADGGEPHPLAVTSPTSVALRTGQAQHVRNGTQFDRHYPHLASARAEAGFESAFSVPFRSSGGDVRGALTVTSPLPDQPGEETRRMLAGLAEQCGLALERAVLRSQAASAVADTTLLAQLGDVLVRPTHSHARARALVDVLTKERVALAVVHLLDDVGRPTVLEQSLTARAAQVEDAVLSALASEAARSADGSTGAVGELELLSVPLHARDETLGVLTIGFGGDDVGVSPGLFRRIAIRAALAIDNALLYEREREVSHSLQLGLLGGEPDVPPETSVATAYRPGTAALEVGGDWYDAFRLPDGRLAILVGDVVGHGLEAAVAMGQLRGAVRALAPMGSPRHVLERLDDLVSTLPEAGMATIAYAELDTATGAFTYACAGHPPPLVVPADGEARLLWNGRTAPLGSSFAKGRDAAGEQLRTGDTLVLYTDGLVERRSCGISERLDLLLEVASGNGNGTPSALVERLLDALLEGEEQEDDVCVLAVRRVASELRFADTFRAAPSEVARMRRAFTSWLEEAGLDLDERRAAALAVSEAAANAAEHAYAFDGIGLVRVNAWVADGQLRVSVRDEGTWREPRAETDRGRGRTMMQALMRDVTIESGPDGTLVQMRLPTRARMSA